MKALGTYVTNANMTKSVNYKSHEESIHESSVPWWPIQYAATDAGKLKKHNSIHEGLRYPCDQCKYADTDAGNLKNFKNSIHECVKYPCDQCEYTSTKPSNLKIRKKFKH